MKKIVCLLVCLFASAANAAVIYNESINGDAAGDTGGVVIGANLGLLSSGTSTVIGTTPGGTDDDWFKFSIDSGFKLDSIVLAAFTGGGNLGWSNNGVNIVIDHVGLLDTTVIGTDLLEGISLSTVAPSFLEMGTYAIKLGTGSNRNSYTLDFNVSGARAVPEPTSIALLGLGLAGIGFSRKKKSA